MYNINNSPIILDHTNTTLRSHCNRRHRKPSRRVNRGVGQDGHGYVVDGGVYDRSATYRDPSPYNIAVYNPSVSTFILRN